MVSLLRGCRLGAGLASGGRSLVRSRPRGYPETFEPFSLAIGLPGVSGGKARLMGKRSGGLRLLIVDDDPHRRRDLEANSQKIPEIAAVAAAGGVGEATALLETDPPDLVIVELESASRPRIAEFGREARATGASVILVTSGQDPSILAEVMEWASGFLPRGSSATAIGYAVQVVRTGAV